MSGPLTRTRHRRHGFSLLEVTIAGFLLLAVIGLALSLFANSHATVGDSLKITDVSMEANRLHSYLDRELRSAMVQQVLDPYGTGHFTSVVYQPVLGLDLSGGPDSGGPLLGPLRELRFVHEIGEANNGSDDDGDGFVDEGFVALYIDRDGNGSFSAAERQIILTHNVAEGISFAFFPTGGAARGTDDELTITFEIVGRLPRPGATIQGHSESRSMRIALRN